MIRPASRRRLRLLLLAIVAGAAGCATTEPYAQRRGTPYVKSTTVEASAGPSGYRISVIARCQAQVVNIWCEPLAERRTSCKKPPTVTRAELDCPKELEFRNVLVSLRAPWGAIYSATSDERSTVDIAIDWAKSGIDPLSDGAATQLSSSWLVTTREGLSLELRVTPQDVEAMRTAIGEATDTQYAAGAIGERAVLKAELVESEPMTIGGAGTIGVSITNSGPQPAYRVIAKLKSGVEALDGIQLSFGRIDPGKTKVRTRRIPLPPALDDRAPIVLANISYANGEELSVKRRFNIGAEVAGAVQQQGLGLNCKSVSSEVSPGERVRVQCELRNKSRAPASELKVVVAVGGALKPNLAPKKLAAGEAVTLEFVGDVPGGAKQGADLPVRVTVSGVDVPPVTQSLAIRVASLAVKCKIEKLTREQYRAKRKRLQAAFDAGALTQKELDKYDAELVSCLQ
ncbi:MAG TPA: hypothetical protein VN253_26735 [Kofleriaceae bacterium]|nr:hypothetical protein [Kofleriaceae bacterium]